MTSLGTADDATPHNLTGDLGLASVSAGLALMERRSQAMADYWRTVAQVHEPSELPAVGYGYLTRMMEDYAAAFAACWAPLTPSGPPPGEQAPVSERAAFETARAA